MINNYDQADHLNLPSSISHVCKGRLEHQEETIVLPHLATDAVTMLMMKIGKTKLDNGRKKFFSVLVCLVFLIFQFSFYGGNHLC